MGLITNTKKETSRTTRRSTRVVVTGKRINGTWIMESKIAPQRRAGNQAQTALPATNRRVRTLH